MERKAKDEQSGWECNKVRGEESLKKSVYACLFFNVFGNGEWRRKECKNTHQLSTIISLNAIPELLYSSAICRHVFKKRPSCREGEAIKTMHSKKKKYKKDGQYLIQLFHITKNLLPSVGFWSSKDQSWHFILPRVSGKSMNLHLASWCSVYKKENTAMKSGRDSYF